MNSKLATAGGLLCASTVAGLVFLWLWLSSTASTSLLGGAAFFLACIPVCLWLMNTAKSAKTTAPAVSPDGTPTAKLVPHAEHTYPSLFVVQGETMRKETLILDKNSIDQLSEATLQKLANNPQLLALIAEQLKAPRPQAAPLPQTEQVKPQKPRLMIHNP
jgi:hypothetical protein